MMQHEQQSLLTQHHTVESIFFSHKSRAGHLEGSMKAEENYLPINPLNVRTPSQGVVASHLRTRTEKATTM